VAELDSPLALASALFVLVLVLVLVLDTSLHIVLIQLWMHACR